MNTNEIKIGKCPKCGTELEYLYNGDGDSDGEFFSMYAYCKKCDERYAETYKLEFVGYFDEEQNLYR